MRNGIILIFCLALVFSCDYLKPEANKIPVARVNNSYLYEEDIESLISENTPPEDSTLIVANFINRWATQQLLIDQAKINLPESQLEEYEKLVKDYKNDLLTEAYKNAIVSRQLDSSISAADYNKYYEENKEIFKLNDELLKLRYIHLDENYSNLSQMRNILGRFNSEDQKVLDSLSIQFKAFNFNDSIWVKKQALMQALPVLRTAASNVLKKSNFAQIQDSLGVYLVKIEDVLKPNDIAPLSHVRPTIREIILNKRKLDLIKELEKDITKDAVKNNKYEVYNNQ
ncbi:MAG: peptidyl-prolyl cis-trans isomerase [Bacteroidia bacterium]|nr:peptidyl-prolyl cis-trans isomerase [Bacteroidia bacterium]MBT8277029.1 peptidyl-prolyl cis-trans isomerase [Bacteroidia bacterium]NNF31914.1 peptidyl-prolyl cis-trans isomerase [Flavobacteriaceae bacterium]NNK53602.1 peptidyl-prolyl cis-trans isomerase [Flavobacteriaceae bacterium]NNM08897.1 peptidyl-prolyl cis-trans isomerase [Flavobacteriaceae bacterium]